MRNRRLMIAGACGVAVVLGTLAGCSRATRYRMNPTPKIDTRAQTEDEIRNSLTLTNDTNFRYFWNDVGRLFLMDRRSQLDPGPNF